MFITTTVHPLFSQRCVLEYEFFITSESCTKMASHEKVTGVYLLEELKHCRMMLSFSYEAIKSYELI